MSKALWGWTREGWVIVLGFTIGLIGFCAWVELTYGLNDETTHLLIRTTARTSLAAFLLSFTARPLLQLTRTSFARTLMRQRRYWGVSFFVSHMAHLYYIVQMVNTEFGGDWLKASDPVTLIFGGASFVLLALMALTSTNGWYQRLGSKNWQRLHKTGAWYAWFIFTFTLTSGALAVGFKPIQSVEMVFLYAVLGLRFVVWRKNKA